MLYQRAGLVIAISSAILAFATYFLLGLHPLLALWIGLFIVGVSMLLTPPEPRPINVGKLVLDSFENIERMIEALGIKSEAIVVPTDRGVYAVIGDTIDLSKLDVDALEKKVFLRMGSSLAVSLKIPVPEVESEDPCTAIGEAIVDKLGIATGLECLEDEARGMLSARFHNVKVLGHSRMSEVMGPIHGVIAAAILAKVRRNPVRIASWNRVGKDMEVVIEVLRA